MENTLLIDFSISYAVPKIEFGASSYSIETALCIQLLNAVLYYCRVDIIVLYYCTVHKREFAYECTSRSVKKTVTEFSFALWIYIGFRARWIRNESQISDQNSWEFSLLLRKICLDRQFLKFKFPLYPSVIWPAQKNCRVRSYIRVFGLTVRYNSKPTLKK